MHPNLADMIRRDAAVEQACEDFSAGRGTIETEDELFELLERDSHLYEVEITVAAAYADRVHPEHGPWTVVNYSMDLELVDLVEDPTDAEPWRWGLAADGWDGTLAEAARLIAECQGDVDPAEIRPWRVRIWDFHTAEPAVFWGLTIEDARALAEARALVEAEPVGHLEFAELVAA